MGLALNPATAVPEVLLRPHDDGQAALPLATEGVLRTVWHSRFGSMLIEVIGADIFVNGQRVVPHAAGPKP